MHADHITGTGFLKQLLPGTKSVISQASGALADQYLEHKDVVEFGRHRIRALATPGHTSGCMTFVVDEQASLNYFHCFMCESAADPVATWKTTWAANSSRVPDGTLPKRRVEQAICDLMFLRLLRLKPGRVSRVIVC